MNANEVYWAIAQTGMVVPKAEGLPGAAKTKCVEAFARAVGRPIYTLIGSLREPADVGGYPYPIQVEAVKDGNGKKTRVYMSLVPPKWAMDCHDGRGWIVFIDELTTCPPAVQAALLRVIAEKYVGDLPLPPETWILAACNPAGVAANGFELEPPMANRLYHHQWSMDANAWHRGMLSGMNFPEPDFTRLPDNWRDSLGCNGARFSGFIMRRPEMLEKYPGDDRVKAGGPWPSPRSITSACVCATAVESVTDDVSARYKAVAGCVGEEFAHEFRIWEQELDLPDPEELIAKAIAAAGNGHALEFPMPKRGDQAIAMLGSVADRVHRNNTKERWEGAMDVLGKVWDRWREVAIIGGEPLSAAYKAGYRLPAKWAMEAFPLMVRAGMLKGGVVRG